MANSNGPAVGAAAGPSAILTELHQIRATASRAEAARRLKKMAEDLTSVEPPPFVGAGGPDDFRQRAVNAIAALTEACQRTEDVPDALWAQAVNLTHAWATAGD